MNIKSFDLKLDTYLPYRSTHIIQLFYQSDNLSSFDEQSFEVESECQVFADWEYQFEIKGDKVSDICDLKMFINDVLIGTSFFMISEDCLSINVNQQKIFLDCFGFVSISFDCEFYNGETICYFTKHLPILVRNTKLTKGIKDMVSYIYNSQYLALVHGDIKSREKSSTHNSSINDIRSQIKLLEEIALIYEQNYHYFKTNARFVIDKVPVIDYLERTKYITPSSVQYIANHPEQLTMVYSTSGIQINNKIFQPIKVLATENRQVKNIYENKVVLDFIGLLIAQVNELKKGCLTRIKKIPINEQFNSEYFYSSYVMLGETKSLLEKSIQKLSMILNKLYELQRGYSSAFEIEAQILHNIPKPTPIFYSIPKYNQFYLIIVKWFNQGIYNFDKDEYLLNMVKTSSIYEMYLYLKMIEYFNFKGFSSENFRIIRYPIADTSKFKNTLIKNIAVFKKNDMEVTLFYQPGILFPNKRQNDEIGLYRNNDISVSDGERTGSYYYVPDFLIKIKKDKSINYLVLDAKFSSKNTIYKYYLKDIVFKYLFSLSPVTQCEKIIGCCIFYGKCEGESTLENVYNKEIKDLSIFPSCELFPVMEGINSEMFCKNFDRLIEKLINFLS